jgi:hypothetical protein
VCVPTGGSFGHSHWRNGNVGCVWCVLSRVVM